MEFFSESTQKYKMERSIVDCCIRMFDFYALKSRKERKEIQEVIHKMRGHLQDLIKDDKKHHSEMIYVLWEQFNDVYEKWMNN